MTSLRLFGAIRWKQNDNGDVRERTRLSVQLRAHANEHGRHNAPTSGARSKVRVSPPRRTQHAQCKSIPQFVTFRRRATRATGNRSDVTSLRASDGKRHAQSRRLAQIASNATPIIEFATLSGTRTMEINKTSIFRTWRVLGWRFGLNVEH